MPTRTFTRDLGAVSASTVAGISLDDRPDLPRDAYVAKATIRNNSQAVLTVVNHSGQPQVDAGERVDVEYGPGSRYVQIQNDAVAVSSGEVKVTITVEWP